VAVASFFRIFFHLFNKLVQMAERKSGGHVRQPDVPPNFRHNDIAMEYIANS